MHTTYIRCLLVFLYIKKSFVQHLQQVSRKTGKSLMLKLLSQFFIIFLYHISSSPKPEDNSSLCFCKKLQGCFLLFFCRALWAFSSMGGKNVRTAVWQLVKIETTELFE